MAKIFTYKNYMVDLKKVAAIEFDDSDIIFSMDADWEYRITIDDNEISSIKKTLVEQFTS